MLCDLPVWKQYFSGAYRIYPLFHRARGYIMRGGPGQTGASAPYSVTSDSTSCHFVSLLQNFQFFLFFVRLKTKNIYFGSK